MNAYIFDVDGVITNPTSKKVEQPEILQKIANLLSQNNFVALNTGRSLTFVNEKVIEPLFEYISDKSKLENFLAIGERGGTWSNFDKDTKIEHHKDNSISTPLDLQKQIKELINKHYAKSMFYDNTKETMISTEMRDGFSIDEYELLQEKLVEQMIKLLNKMNLNQTLKIDPTTIATDIENKIVGKDFAIERILEYIKEKGLHPREFIAFGDSSSDIPMAEKLYEQGVFVKLVYVGKRTFEENNYPFPITFTKEKFDKGTLEYLTKLA